MDRIARRALVCDDDPTVRRVVGGILAERGFEVIAEVELATDALHVAAISQPHVIVLDVALMGMTGIEAIPAIRRASPDAFLIVFSSFDTARDEAAAAGADSVIDKADAMELDRALATIAAA